MQIIDTITCFIYNFLLYYAVKGARIHSEAAHYCNVMYYPHYIRNRIKLRALAVSTQL